jgi:phage terminase large subunit GpA-like protein
MPRFWGAMMGFSLGIRSSVLAALKALAPPPDLKPSEWAERSVYIPVGNAIPGLIKFDNAPYQREPLDMSIDPECSRITLMWGGQVGKTMLALCAQAYRISQDPVAQIMMQPSEGDLTTWLTTKFNPLVEANAELEAKIATPRSRSGVNNTRMKSYPGGHIMFSWSGSPKTMRGRSAPFIVCDETDGYDRVKEGHPVSLLWQRAATFGDQRMLLEISTPTIKGVSWIESAFEAGDQRRFHVACPNCGHVQPLRWSSVKWGMDDDGEHDPASAYYLCESGAGCWWSDQDRVEAIRGAEAAGHGWIAARPFRGHASYHLSELYSCFRSLSDVVQSFLEKKQANDLQTFINVSLAETWEEEAESLELADVMSGVEKFAAPVPAAAGVLTAGVDMQEDRLECEVVGWGVGEESWSVDQKVIWGDPLKPEVWNELFAYLGGTWRHESGSELKLAATCVDTGGSGGLTQAAYEQLRGKQRRRIFAIKGKGGWNMPIVSAPSKWKTGRRGRAVTGFTVGVDEAKLVIIRRLKTEEGAGACHFPEGRDPEFFLQLTAERLVTKLVRGFPFQKWHKTRERNEALDCRVYAYAALKIVNPKIPRIVAALNVSFKAGEPPEETEPVAAKTRQRKKRPTRGRLRRPKREG